MNFLKKVAIFFFDIINKYIHQKKILKYIKKNLDNIKIVFDVGSHRRTYTDMIINNIKIKKVLMFEHKKNI